MPIFDGHDSAYTLADVTSNNNHTRMVHGDPFATYTKAASGYVGIAPGIQCSALSRALRHVFTEQGKFLAAVAEARDNPEQAQERRNVPVGMLMAMMG